MVYLCLNTLSPFYQGLTQHIMQNKLLAFNPSDPPHLTPVAHHIFSHLLGSCTSTLLTRGNCAWKTKTAKAQPFYQGELARGSTLLSDCLSHFTMALCSPFSLNFSCLDLLQVPAPVGLPLLFHGIPFIKGTRCPALLTRVG